MSEIIFLTLLGYFQAWCLLPLSLWVLPFYCSIGSLFLPCFIPFDREIFWDSNLITLFPFLKFGMGCSLVLNINKSMSSNYRWRSKPLKNKNIMILETHFSENHISTSSTLMLTKTLTEQLPCGSFQWFLCICLLMWQPVFLMPVQRWLTIEFWSICFPKGFLPYTISCEGYTVLSKGHLSADDFF